MPTIRELRKLYDERLRQSKYLGERSMYTGRVVGNTVTMDGAPLNKTWVRATPDSREETAAWSWSGGAIRQPNVKVVCDYNSAGELYIKHPDFAPATEEVGAGLAAAMMPAVPSEAFNSLVLDGRQFKPGRGRLAAASGSMALYIEPFMHSHGAWLGGAVDLTAYVPATIGMNCWCVAAVDPATNAAYAVAGSETAVDVTYMDEADIHIIPIPGGHYPCRAVALSAGMTELTSNTRMIDLRRHLSAASLPFLDDLANVNSGGKADGDTLVWDQTAEEWVPGAGGGGGGASELDDLTDVDLTTTPPADGQALVFDNISSQWIPGDVTFDEWELIEQVDLVYRQRIARITLDAPGAFTFDLAALGAVAAGYDRIYLFARVRGNVAAAGDVARIWVNGDKTATNYRTSRHYGGSAHGGDVQNYPLFCDMPAGTAPSAHFNVVWGVIEEPFVAGKTKSIRIHTNRVDSTTSTFILDFTIERLGSSAAISTLEIVTDNDPTDLFAAGSYIELVGEKYGPISVPVITPHALDDLTDVDLTAPPTDGDVLYYNGTATQWEAAPPAGTHVIKKTFREAELLYDHTFAVAASATPVWALPPGYDSIEIEVAARCDGAVAHTRMGVILNGETLNTNYLWQYHYGSSSAGVQQVNARYAGYIAGTTTTGYNLYTTHKMELRDYASSAIHKHLLNQYSPHASGSYVAVGMASVVWKNIAPVTTIQFDVVEGGYNFLAGSRFKLWGVKSREVVVDGRASDPTPPSPPAQVASFAIAGAVGVGAQPFRIYNVWGSAKTITKVHAAVDIAPQGADLIIDVEKNGTTIFTTQANRPVIAANANTGQSTTIDVATLNEGDYLQFSVDQVGSTTPGSDLVIQVMLE